jgi:hypothetical protein
VRHFWGFALSRDTIQRRFRHDRVTHGVAEPREAPPKIVLPDLDLLRLQPVSPRRPAFVLALSLTAQLLMAQRAAADPSSTSPQQGYDSGELQSPRNVAFGGAQTALGTGTTALISNPANLSFAKVYHFETVGTAGPEARRWSYGGAVADSVTNKLAGGFAGAWSTMDPDGIDRTWTDLRLSLAYPLTSWLSVGLTGRYLRMSQTTARGPFRSDLLSGGTADQSLVNTFSFNAGLTIQPLQGLSFGVVGANLTHPATGIMPTTLAAGAGWANELFSVEYDAIIDFDTWGKPRARHALGIELFLVNHLLLRGGYRIDTGMRTQSVSGGIGYVDRRFSIEFSTRRDVVADHPATLLVLGIKYFYDAGIQPDQAMGAD